MEVPEQELPPSYEWFADQIAGHHPSVIKNGKREIGASYSNVIYTSNARAMKLRKMSVLGILKQNGSDKVLKPKQDGLRGECEVNVYKLLESALRHTTSGEVNYDGRGNSKPIGWESVREEDVIGLTQLTPAFHGITSVSIDKEGEST
ncbi:unnamed protein product [Strongylus vulgaris]|uniref:Uncharacterized protein n=1 Tax=Strongylus vulgaris TaxID=40348 RepID=A0A3P7JS52_STRVU|nr:unnamed protein product [Strongylus vulgaris]